MYTLKLKLTIASCLLIFGCKNDESRFNDHSDKPKTEYSCSQISQGFSSYDLAISAIKGSTFRFKDKVNTSKSSWVRGAEFYSCDGNFGYFIIYTDSEDYLYEGISLKMWDEFKTATSFGTYYNNNIKGRFQYHLR